jgi:hypothetical protein
MIIITLKAWKKFYEAILREGDRYITTLKSRDPEKDPKCLALLADEIYENFRDSVKNPGEIKFVFEEGQFSTRKFLEDEKEEIKKEVLSRYKTRVG